MASSRTRRFLLSLAVVALGTGIFVVPTAGAASAPTWKRVASVKVPAASSALADVECLAANDCIAVGWFGADAEHTQTLVARWNGAAWVRVVSPNRVSNGAFTGISCLSASFCIAVGNGGRFGGTPFAQRWNGVRWSAVPFADPHLPGDSLALPERVSCATATSCMAVGYEYRDRDGALLTFSEHWDGNTFAIVPTNATGGLWHGVDCPSATRCVSVGAVPSGIPRRASAAVWNGTRWAGVGVPLPPGGKRSELYGLSCTSASSCVATGEWSKSSDPAAATSSFAVRWDGARWHRIASPKPAVDRAPLFDVSCATATACVAVGEAWTSRQQELVIVPISAELSGAKFAPVATPRLPGDDTPLFAVSCADATHCLAVGVDWTGTDTGSALAEVFAP